MSGPWEAYQPQKGPWDQYRAGGKDTRPKSQALGFVQGSLPAMRNMAKVSPFGPAAKKLMEVGQNGLQQYVDERSKTARPGAIGTVAGSLAASSPAIFVPGGAAVQGAAFGAIGSTAQTPGELGRDVAIGAIAGKVGEKVVGAVGNALQSATRPAVKTLQNAGIKLTPGQIAGGKAMAREDKLMSRPGVGPKIAADRAAGVEQFNRSLIDEAMAPLGIKLPPTVKTGHDAVAFAQGAVKRAYQAVVPKLTVQLDDKLMAGMQEVANEARMLPTAGQQAVVNAVKASGFNRAGVLSGEQLQAARSNLARLARSYSTSADAQQREAGRLLGWVTEHVDDALVRQNPNLAPAFQAANRAFRGQTIIDDAASRADGGVFSTGQAKQAARRADMSRRKTATARGEGPMGNLINAARDVLPAVAPNPSGTASHLNAGSIVQMLLGVGSRAGYAARSATANAASRLPAGVGQAVQRQARPVGIATGAAVPSIAHAKEKRP